jgi:hypothetical protein
VEPKPAFDDPSLRASLSALDRGLGGEARSEASPRRTAQPAPPERTAEPVIPPIFPESALLPQPTPPVTRGAVPPVPSRPLLDLFPPTAGRLRARESTLSGALSSRTLGPETAASGIDETMITPAASDEDVATPADGHPIARRIALAVVFVLLMLAGAGAAAWVFRDEVSRLRSQWQSAPP